MKYPDFSKENLTYGELYCYAMEVTDQTEAERLFTDLVNYSVNWHGGSKEEAERVERNNLCYFAGYFDFETMARVNKLFHTKHPVFGS